jgi:hypothetical protein
MRDNEEMQNQVSQSHAMQESGRMDQTSQSVVNSNQLDPDEIFGMDTWKNLHVTFHKEFHEIL